MNALELHGVQKTYPDFTLGPIDLTLPGGTVCGLIGENGAGKSTTIKLILDMIDGDAGTVKLFGQEGDHPACQSRYRRGAERRGHPHLPDRRTGGKGDGGHLPQLGRRGLCRILQAL